MMNCATIDLGLHRVRLARLRLCGELSFEINCPTNKHASLRKLLLTAGSEAKLKEIGNLSMLSMRLEKSIGVWYTDFTQGYTPKQTGLDRWIAWNTGSFIGKKAARNAPEPERILAMLEVLVIDAAPIGLEPVWLGEDMIGMTTSDGYGHRTEKSYALAKINTDQCAIETPCEVPVMRHKARIIDISPCDPTGSSMQACHYQVCINHQGLS